MSWYRHPNVSGSISICNVDECDHSYHSRVFLCDSFTVQMLFYICGNLDFKGKDSTPRKWGLKPKSHWDIIWWHLLFKNIYIYILCPCSVVIPPVYKVNISEYNNKNEGKKKETTQLIHLDTETQGKTKIKTSLSK